VTKRRVVNFTAQAHIGNYVSQSTAPNGMLGPDDLRQPVDSAILDLLAEGRVTPRYVRDRLDADGVDDYSRSYIHQRLARLEEHGHVRNLLGDGLYELTDDPREVPDDAE